MKRDLLCSLWLAAPVHSQQLKWNSCKINVAGDEYVLVLDRKTAY